LKRTLKETYLGHKRHLSLFAPDVFCWQSLVTLSNAGDVGIVAGIDRVVVVVEGGRGGWSRMVVVVDDEGGVVWKLWE
jgi:hypothetical protein